MVSTEGFETGKKEAEQLLKKIKPRTTRSIVKIAHILRNNLKTKYMLNNRGWKNDYGHGAFHALSTYQTNLLKEEWGKK